ncbi:hypothetical protein LOTGIDRAFT_110966 [Lottia gigantea]|uniref:Ubiquitin-like domain-containing protein n=1 Tax=Lottia gigantea TaxID=225164 RepID=V4B684_LOTGI|nr:hypothetical protein LOTGIDRAFT_110966 [Lottia gigantea]ESP03051.1 hypothetical protein LOTGIDRAFT_110966 [Lottia gigantea]
MSLIEGIGDEVTLVFGLLVILVVGLLAWFSTHTSDIPFFSVIVVELSQRVRNGNRNLQTTCSVQEENPDVQSVSQQGGSTDCPEISETSVHSETTSENQIRVRLKYLNDTQRLVFARPLDTIGYFKRTHFPDELAQQKLVRLIYNGQDLRNETSTLQSCNVVDNSVLHCLVTQNIQPQQTVHTNQDEDINIGNFMIPIFGLILGALWYLRFNYKQYFNATSTLSLAGISFLFVFATFTVLRPHNPQQANRHLE